MNLVGQVLENRYRLREPIGVGGMGTVYLAEHVLLGEICAVKVLSPRFAFDPEWVERFLLEARAAIRIRHDNVVQIKDFACPEPGLVYMVMEAISGESLADLLRREGAVPWERALRMAAHIASALEAAHGCGIIHRDIKPSNCVRTTSRGDPDFIKVLDFGIAKFTTTADQDIQAPRTATGVWMGTAEYMAPEMYRGDPPDGRVDIYALGVLIYKLITGETPFQGTHIEVAFEQSRRDPTPPSKRAPGRKIPAKVDTLVLRALARDLNTRIPSMTALREGIAATLDSPEEVSLTVDIEEDETTTIRKIALPANYIPTGLATPPTTKPPAAAVPALSSNPQANTSPPRTALPLPAPPASAKLPLPFAPPLTAPSQPLSPPHSVATQTEPRSIVSAPDPPVPSTEVTRSRWRLGLAPLAAGAAAGIVVLTAVMWRMTARLSPGTDERVATTSVATADISREPLAPARTLTPDPAAPSTPMLDPSPAVDPTPATNLAPPTPDPASTLPSLTQPPPQPSPPPADKTIVPESKRPANKSKRPPPRQEVPGPPVVDPWPVAITERDVSGILDRLQRECVSWGVPRGRSATMDITINGEGSATYQTVGISDPFFVDCLGKKLKGTKFPQTRNGGKFRHAFTCG